MTEFLKKNYKYLIAIIVGFVIGIMVNIPSCSKLPDPQIIKVPVHDTVRIDSIQIKWKEKPVEVLRIDTFYTTKDGDTIETPEIPIIKKVYEDTISTDSTSTEIRIQYSGFNANIDEIWLRHNYYNSKEIITKPPKKIGLVWFVGAGVGYGVHGSMNTGTFGHGPEVGITVGIGIGGIIK